jgi:hypothetical protein
MPYRSKDDERARWKRRAAAKKAERLADPKPGKSHKRKPYNPGPWKSAEPKPWILKGCAP